MSMVPSSPGPTHWGRGYVHGTHKVSWGMGEGLILLLEALHYPNVPKLHVCGGGQVVVEAAGGSLCNSILS